MKPFSGRQSTSEPYRRALLDLVAIAAALGGVYFLIVDLDLFERLHEFSRSHEDWELDELIVAALLSVIGVYAFGIRRLFDQQREIKIRQEAEQTARKLAQVDSLTGVANRRRFEERLTEGLHMMAQGGGRLALMMIDLDHFKPLNDVFGHTAGDQILVDFARRANRLLGSNGLMARVGGDEFAAVLQPLSSDDEADQLARQLLGLFDYPLETDAGIRVTAGCSIGVAIAPEDGSTADALIRRADIALYRAKHSGRQNFRRFEADMDAGDRQRAAIEGDLRGAIADGAIRPFYQPIVDLRSREITGFEAQATWHHPVLGDIPSRDFMRIAENTGLVARLATHLLRHACRDALAWPKPVRLSFNLSRAQLADATLILKTVKIPTETGFDPRRLEIEISEAALFGDIDTAQKALATFHQFGISVALGDFGSGNSGINHLRQVRFDRLKIDKSLIDNMTSSKNGLAFVQAILGLARALNIPVSAEGIERGETADRLLAEGCSEGQGVLFGKAVPAEEVVEYLSATPPRSEAADPLAVPYVDGSSRTSPKAMSWSSRSCMPNSRTRYGCSHRS